MNVTKHPQLGTWIWEGFIKNENLNIIGIFYKIVYIFHEKFSKKITSGMGLVNPTSGGLRRGKEVEGGGQFDPPYLKALKSHSKVAKWV